MIVLSVGTAHPWNVAGTGRDVVVGERHGARVFTAIAAVSAQDGAGVRALQPIDCSVFRAQLAALPWEAAGAVRVGALGTMAHVSEMAAALHERPALPAVVDPVFQASRGGALYRDGDPRSLVAAFASLPNVVLTPNAQEAAVLLETPVSRDGIAEAATTLQRRGACAILLKGGHLAGDPVDALATSGGVDLFCAPRIAGSMHGIGCTLAMAVACSLAQGRTLHDAVVAARGFVRAEIARH
jgi:hydroxymethylpyrimidine/phosphomethylpyrimidine kinase